MRHAAPVAPTFPASCGERCLCSDLHDAVHQLDKDLDVDRGLRGIVERLHPGHLADLDPAKDHGRPHVQALDGALEEDDIGRLFLEDFASPKNMTPAITTLSRPPQRRQSLWDWPCFPCASPSSPAPAVGPGLRHYAVVASASPRLRKARIFGSGEAGASSGAPRQHGPGLSVQKDAVVANAQRCSPRG